MQAFDEYPVVPMGRMSIGNALNGRPRKRVPLGGAKLHTKDEERKKPSLKDLFGVTPLDILGNVSADELPSPVKLFQRFLGTSTAKGTDPQPQELQPQEQKEQEVEQCCWQQQQGVGHPAPLAHQHPNEDTRTNLEKYMSLKMQGSRSHLQPCPMAGIAPAYYAPNPYMSQSHMQALPCLPSVNTPVATTVGIQNGATQGVASAYPTQYSFDDSAAYEEGSSTEPSVTMGPTVDQLDASQHPYAPASLQFETPPAWFQHKSYVPQAPQYSHMTAPVPGAPFHPGFSYATDFKYYYNYYSADQYAGELDGDATAQEEAVAREQQHAEELVSRQISQAGESAAILKPIITSKRRLESGRAVVM